MSIYFEWTKDMSVNETTIDYQHQRLLSQVNKIIEAVVSGDGQEEVESTLNFFDEYIKEHFLYEEQYMLKIGFQGVEEHKKEHQEFIDNYILFKKKFTDGTPQNILIMDIERYLGGWWINHIGVEDHKYIV